MTFADEYRRTVERDRRTVRVQVACPKCDRQFWVAAERIAEPQRAECTACKEVFSFEVGKC